MNNDIKVLLFDLGGVVIDIDPKIAISELKKYPPRRLLNSKKWIIGMKPLTLIYQSFLTHMKREKFPINLLGTD